MGDGKHALPGPICKLRPVALSRVTEIPQSREHQLELKHDHHLL